MPAGTKVARLTVTLGKARDELSDEQEDGQSVIWSVARRGVAIAGRRRKE